MANDRYDRDDTWNNRMRPTDEGRISYGDYDRDQRHDHRSEPRQDYREWNRPDYGLDRDPGRNFGRDWGQSFNRDNSASRPGSHVGKGPKGWKRSDERIREEVSETLERHPDINASEIEVDVNEGIVTLRGAVEHRLQKRMAEDSIEYITGVKDVRNEISVNQSLFQQARELLTGEPSKSDRNASSKGTPRH